MSRMSVAAPAWMLTIAMAVWAGIRLSYSSSRGDAQLFDFFFWLFAYIFMGLAPTVQMRSGLLSTTTPGMNPISTSRRPRSSGSGCSVTSSGG